MFLSFKKRKVKNQIVVIATILAAIFLGVTVSLIVVRVKVILQNTILNNSQIELELATTRLSSIAENVREDVQLISKIPELVDFLNLSYQSTSTDNFRQRKSFITNLFIAEEETKKIYDQLRLINLEGKEVLRVDFDDKQGAIVVSEENLQDKSSRSYVVETNKLSPGSMYTSPVSLNREGINQDIERPYLPVVRYGIPLFTMNGDRIGMIIANVRIKDSLNSIVIEGVDVTPYAVDSNGYYLLHPDSTKLWGSPIDLNTGANITRDIDGLDTQVFQRDTYFQLLENNVLLTSRVKLGSDLSPSYVIVLKQQSLYSLFTPVRTFVIYTVLVGISMFIVLFFVFLFSVAKVLSPIQKITQAAKKIGKGEFDTKIPKATVGELAELANAFEDMREGLKKQYTKFESSVVKKNDELEKKLLELNKTRKAMTNLLEDIDAEKKRAVKASNELKKFELAMASTSDFVSITDSKQRIIYTNPATEKITGFSQKYVQGKTIRELWAKNVPKEIDKNIMTTIDKKKESYTGTVLFTRKDGSTFDAAISISPVLDEKNKIQYLVSTARDVSAERAVDKAKTEFVSLASHQLRTPLSTINWYVEMLLNGEAGEINTEQKEHLEEIHDGNQRMIDLVNALLNVSRLELGTFTVEPKKTDIKKLVERVVKEQLPHIKEKKLAFTKKIPKVIPSLKVDPKLTWIVLQNYLSNAVKYTPEEGTVKVSMEVKKAGEKCLDKKLKEDMLCYAVSDTGCGIPKNQQDKIFTKLFRADNVRTMDVSGTGLGLYIVKAIIEQTGGFVGFTSKAGKGSTFYATIPLSGMKQRKGTKTLNS